MNNIKVIMPGIFTTIQDLGRYGAQEVGITTSGVMDSFSARIANALVGNDSKNAVLETTFMGPTLEFLEEMVIAVTGAKGTVKINNEEINMWESIKVSSGDKLSFGKIEKGLRNYIAFSGDIDVEPINNSKSTLISSQMGGYQGRALKAKDELKIIINKNAKAGKKLEEKYIPNLEPFQVARVVLGPQDDYFTEKGIHDFFKSGGYMITKDFNRMGIRLTGKKLELKNGSDIISDGTVMGSIQVPSNGLPIILMADRQTTGGYTKIGTVITEDLPKLGQLKAMDRICFKQISLEDAQKSYREYETNLRKLEEELRK